MNLLTKTNLLSALVIFSISKVCYSTIINSVEGQSVNFNFSYPCNSSNVTLQLGNGAPFYSSKSSLHEGWIETIFDNLLVRETRLDSICMIKVWLNPVMRIHGGTYICFSYNENGSPLKLTRIGLNVDYPPGRASCERSSDYTDADLEWVSLTCTASVGSMKGYIQCFQNGMKMPTKTAPTQNDQNLQQTLIVRSNHSAFCCSSAFEQPKSMCECKDAHWNALQNGQDINPCPVTSPTPSQSTTNDIVTSVPQSMSSLDTGQAPEYRNELTKYSKVMLAVTAVSVFVIFVALLVGFLMPWKKGEQKCESKPLRYTVAYRFTKISSNPVTPPNDET